MRDSDPTAFGDIHSHLVPGVDDGAHSVSDTLDAVGRMTVEGVRKILTTPHLDGSLTLDAQALEERLAEVHEGWDEASTAVGRDFPEVDFRRGHEVMLDVPDVDLSDARVRLAGTSFVLVEWPRLQLPPGTEHVLRRIRSDGYRPIVAHPERYVGMDRELELVVRWRETGAFIQVNLGSLSGRYGDSAKRAAFRLLRRGWVDYLSSDFHARPHLKLYYREARERLLALGAEEAYHILCRTNPARVFRDEEPIPVPLLPPERGFWAKMKGFLRAESAS